MDEQTQTMTAALPSCLDFGQLSRTSSIRSLDLVPPKRLSIIRVHIATTTKIESVSTAIADDFMNSLDPGDFDNIDNMSDTGSSLHTWFSNSVDRMRVSDVDSVQRWLEDLRGMTETECMCILQGKSISGAIKEGQKTKRIHSVKDKLRILRHKAGAITSQFAKTFHKLDKEKWAAVHTCVIDMVCNIRQMLHDCTENIENGPDPMAIFVEQEVVMEECAKLVQNVESFDRINGEKPQSMPVLNCLGDLAESFTKLVDMLEMHLIKTLFDWLGDESSCCVKTAITVLTNLAQEDDRWSRLIAKDGGMQALFHLCRQDTFSFLRTDALRAVAIICCMVENIVELERADGVECITDILCDTKTSEDVRTEAAGVIAQITSPDLDHYKPIMGFIENLEDLVKALIALSRDASNSDVFLVATAAIANVTFMDSMASDFLAQYNAASVLIQGCHKKKAPSLYAKDQVATILANMACIEQCREEIAAENGIDLLVQYLHEQPRPHINGFLSEDELSACERVHQKAAIALARLSREINNADIIYKAKGIPRLVQLCKDHRERNSSDSVLVACLAALRKLYSMLGNTAFDPEDTVQLIQPRLLDSYLYCTSMEETFV
ncbi:protein inscuteable homolog isoform X3 [Ptychodera flava]|uniref:protein inscuteable homolog isoform X3 n=1 Tax=Ptychodera flava TaxID=63121 RepID=UPI003969FC05